MSDRFEASGAGPSRHTAAMTSVRAGGTLITPSSASDAIA